MRLTQQPNRNFRTDPYWMTTQFIYTVPISVAPNLNENNIQFALSNTNVNPSAYTFFDQFCIYEVVVGFSVNQSSNGSSYFGDLLTAIDYDDVANLGSVSKLQQRSSINQHQFKAASELIRVVKPCVDISLYNTPTSSYSTGRLWVDMSNTTTPHYGVRVMISGAQIAWTMEVTLTFLLGFRMQI